VALLLARLPDDVARTVVLAWRWVQGYRELLGTLGAWHERAAFDVQRARLLRHQYRRGQGPSLTRALAAVGLAPAAGVSAPAGASAGGGGGGDVDTELEAAALTALLSLARYSAGLAPLPPGAPPRPPPPPADRAGSGDGILTLGPRRSQMHVRCGSCRASLSLPSLVEGSASGVEWLSRQRPHMLSCPACRKPLPRCALCLLPLGCINPVMQLQHEMRQRHAAARGSGGGAAGGSGGGGSGPAGGGSSGFGPTEPQGGLRSPTLLTLGGGGGVGGGGAPLSPALLPSSALLPTVVEAGGDGSAGDGEGGVVQSAATTGKSSRPASAASLAAAPAAADGGAGVGLGSLRPAGHLRDALPFEDMWTWCQSCRHGGHASHLAEWFGSGRTVCPVAECMCHCALMDRGALTSGRSYAPPPVGGDE
jgi:hypothetical protein